jgi:hypothetical protein
MVRVITKPKPEPLPSWIELVIPCRPKPLCPA